MKTAQKHFRYATVNEREELLKFVRVQCLQHNVIRDSYLLKTYFTAGAIGTLIKHGIIEKISDELHRYKWLKGWEDSEIPGLLQLCWKRHSKESTEVMTKKKRASINGLIANDGTQLEMPVYDITETLGSQRAKFLDLLDTAITMCANYQCQNYGAYIKHFIMERI